jgi:hypothetical protein
MSILPAVQAPPEALFLLLAAAEASSSPKDETRPAMGAEAHSSRRGLVITVLIALMSQTGATPSHRAASLLAIIFC